MFERSNGRHVHHTRFIDGKSSSSLHGMGSTSVDIWLFLGRFLRRLYLLAKRAGSFQCMNSQTVDHLPWVRSWWQGYVII